MNKLTSRFFEVDGQSKLVAIEVQEGQEAALPRGSLLVHSEPLISEEGAIYGFDLWALVPSDAMAEVVNTVGDPDAQQV